MFSEFNMYLNLYSHDSKDPEMQDPRLEKLMKSTVSDGSRKKKGD